MDELGRADSGGLDPAEKQAEEGERAAASKPLPKKKSEGVGAQDRPQIRAPGGEHRRRLADPEPRNVGDDERRDRDEGDRSPTGRPEPARHEQDCDEVAPVAGDLRPKQIRRSRRERIPRAGDCLRLVGLLCQRRRQEPVLVFAVTAGSVSARLALRRRLAGLLADELPRRRL